VGLIAVALRQARALEASLRLTTPPAIAAAILRYGAMVGCEIEHLPQAPRCMELARDQIRACEEAGRSFPSGQVIVADRLTGGKGRFSRHWHAPAGGVWLVLTLVNTLLARHALLLPLAAGVACCETARHFGVMATVKWVNDVLANHRKLAGVLVETMRGPQSGEDYVLIGIGLNVNNRSFAPELRDTATSMADYAGRTFDLSEVTAALLAKLSWNIGLLHQVEAEWLAACVEEDDEPPHHLIEAWRAVSDTVGRRVRFGFNVALAPQFTAQVTEIDNRGRLLMRLADGRLVSENSGEIAYL